MTVALGFRRRLQTGPALRISPIPVASLTLSTVLHAALIVAAVIAVNTLKERQPTVYVVNLVPAIPAIGRPEGTATTPAPAPPVARPEPPAPRPPDLPARTSPPRDVAPRELPARTRVRESPGLPDRTLPPRSAAPATTRRDQKELPSVAHTARAETPTPAPAPRDAARETPAAPPPPIPAGLPTGSPYGKGKLSIEVDFPYAWYVKIIRDRIGDRWDPQALPGAQPLVSFEIARNGQVSLGRIRIKQSSGNRAYDQVAIRAIAEASPFPPLPDDFKDQLVTINIQFRFDAPQG